jgi:hypothetical protein
MASPYDKSLTSLGIVVNGELAKSFKDKFVEDVISLLKSGNEGGNGGSDSLKILSSVVPLPPSAGPQIGLENFFWFKPDKNWELTAERLRDPSKSKTWHETYVDSLLTKTTLSMDVKGSTPLFPIFDTSVAFPSVKGFPLSIDDIALQLDIQPSSLVLLKLAELNIQIGLPNIPVPPIPSAPPNIELDPNVELPSLVVPSVSLEFMKLPFSILSDLVFPPNLKLLTDLPNLPKLVTELAFDRVLDITASLGLQNALSKTFAATTIAYIKNIVGMLCVNVVSMLAGSGGAMANSVALATGLL